MVSGTLIFFFFFLFFGLGCFAGGWWMGWWMGGVFEGDFKGFLLRGRGGGRRGLVVVLGGGWGVDAWWRE